MCKKIKFKKFKNKNELFKECLQIFKKKTVHKNIIVTGGNTYKSFYSILCKKKINWKNVNLILSDERLTSKKNLQNYSIINNYLLRKLKKNKPKIFFNVNKVNFKQKKKLLNSLEKKFLLLGKVKTAFLSVGSDGHIASIFRKKPNIYSPFMNFIITKKNNENFSRISFSKNFFNKVSQIIIIVFGKNKKNILSKILSKKFNKFKEPIFDLLKFSKSNIKIYYI